MKLLPTLYNITGNHQEMVQDMESWIGNSWDWNLYVPELQNQEKVAMQCADLLEILLCGSLMKMVIFLSIFL